VAIGGGTGLPAVLEGLTAECLARGESYEEAVTGVVTVTDEGGSSGQIRRACRVLPPGDARNCLVALAGEGSPYRDLLQHRLPADADLEAHPIGNLLLMALTQLTGDFSRAVDALGTLIGARGRVLPTTAAHVRLRAELESGALLTGETEIVGKGSPIRRLFLSPSPRPEPDVLRALVNADAIVVGPGSLYTSVLPSLLVEGVAATIYGVDAVRIYVANLMTEPGETDGFDLDDHLRVIRMHTGFDLFDYILVNRRPADAAALERYASRGSRPVAADGPLRWAGRATVIERDLGIEWGDRKIRHDPAALGAAIRDLAGQKKVRQLVS
jgi:uncharacterized cofD-like protein